MWAGPVAYAEMGHAHVFEFSPDRVPWTWAFGDRGKAVLLQSLGGQQKEGQQNRALQGAWICVRVCHSW